MFENFLAQEDSSAIDVLIKLLDKDNPETKTDLEMSQIKLATKNKWFELRSLEINKNKTAQQLMQEVIEYYMILKMSYKRRREGAIIKGLSEMKHELLENLNEIKQNVK